MKGKLISISGLDGAGKSTQIELLKSELNKQGIKSTNFVFDATHYGCEAKKAVEHLADNEVIFTRLCIDWNNRYPLIRDFVYKKELQTSKIAAAVSTVFAGGCIQVYEECILPLISMGKHVVCDRFWIDDVVYRSFWLDEDFIRTLYKEIPFPDLAIFLHTSSDAVFSRNQSRIDGKSPLMGSKETIDIINSKFLNLADKESMVIIDGDREKKYILQDILSFFSKATNMSLTTDIS